MTEPSARAARPAAAFVALTALAASAPALWLPLLSDDWMNLAAVSDGVPWRTPFGYVRPLYLALFRAGRLLWGLTPWPYHIISMALFVASALLVFTLVKRLSGDRALALGAGVVFALQPFSIEATAWASSQADLLACMFTLTSLLAWVSWRRSARPAALAGSVACFVLALLSKESAVVVPPLIALIEWRLLRTERRPRAVMAVIVTMAVVAAGHILLLRPHVLGVEGTGLPKIALRPVIGTAIGFVTATALPLPVEFLELHRRSAALAAGVLLVLLVLVVRRAAGRIPAAACFALMAAVIAGVPALFALQERYFLLASAGVAVVMVAMVRACGRQARLAITATIAVIWCVSIATQWAEWFAAGRCSVALIADLTREAADPGVSEIVIANLPHRVRGAPVVTNMATVVELVTHRNIPVALAGRVDYFSSLEDGMNMVDEPPVRDGDDVIVRLTVPSTVYRRFVRPLVAIGERSTTQGDGTVSRFDAEHYEIRIPLREAEGRSVMIWQYGRLVPVRSLLP